MCSSDLNCSARLEAWLHGRLEACRYGETPLAGLCRVEHCPRTMSGPTDENPAPDDPGHLVTGFHFRVSLPHLKREGATYFVTFRLADSLPAHEVVRLKHEREVILEQARAAKRPLTSPPG